MDTEEKSKYKSAFKKNPDVFADRLEKYVSTENGGWSVKGFSRIQRTH